MGGKIHKENWKEKIKGYGHFLEKIRRVYRYMACNGIGLQMQFMTSFVKEQQCSFTKTF